MVRLTTAVILLAWWGASPLAQPPHEQNAAPQSPAVKQTTGEPNALAASPTPYPLDSFPEFSAVMVGSRAEPGEGASEGHIYRSGRLMRMEDPGRQGYYITDLSASETYAMSEAGCMNDEHAFIRSFPFSAAAKPDVTVTRTAVGKETVDGHSCQIENVTVSSARFANPLKMRFWEAEDLQGFPLKIEFLLPGGHDAIIRYKRVVLGPQDPTLFIHPKSCEPPAQHETKPQAAPARKDPPDK